ncbi:ABC transporter [Cryobacterium sp. TMB1-7]|uniref:ABC transporter n=1 Tax=Cryobacterium sp. TMB1-7 TaxID=2555866 RepID=UPI00106BD83F|nr:ABC transporter [Cryobacterium sp. TMB1-7]TFC58205.1 ABC transporter [Cryobacterium sp. TMB1-7]
MPPSSSLTTAPLTTRTVASVLGAAALLGITACSNPAASPAPAPTASTAPHGYVAGAAEMAEPQLHLATVNSAGRLDLLDLLDGTSTSVTTLDQVSGVSTDGRFVFAAAAEQGAVTIVDSGAWTVDHEDHQHYYRADPAVVGTVTGSGAGVTSGGGTLTTVRFADTGTAVILDTGDLGDGTITELARIDVEPGPGMLAPVGDRVIAGRTDAPGSATNGIDAVQVLTSSGVPIAGATADCAELSGTISTAVGVVFGCSDGALLATADTASAGEGAAESTITFERIPYPAGVAATDRALEFANRAGRPTVAAVAGDTGAWLLDTRERRWSPLVTDTPLLQVSAVDDSAEHVVALAEDGRVLVLEAATGSTLAATQPLLPATLAATGAEALLAGVELTVDAGRAYLNAPADGLVYEIDYADGARIARTFPIDGEPRFLAETGR